MGQRHRHRPHGRRQVGYGQAKRKQLAIDHSVAQSRTDAEPHPPAQGVHPLVQPLAVARLGGGQAVAQHDPVDRLARGRRPVLARLPHRLGIETGLLQIQGHRIDLAQHVEVDKAVVHRRDDHVRMLVRQPRQGRVGAGRIDHHEIDPAGDCAQHALEPADLILHRARH